MEHKSQKSALYNRRNLSFDFLGIVDVKTHLNIRKKKLKSARYYRHNCRQNFTFWGGICHFFFFFHDNKVHFKFLIDILL